MFVEVVRRHLEAIPAGGTGWLAGLRDEFVGRGLGQLHRTPAHPWTLVTLAHQAGMSRSSFAERFARVIGMTPLNYLLQWRIAVARNMLAREQMSVAESQGVGSARSPLWLRSAVSAGTAALSPESMHGELGLSRKSP